MSRRARSSVVTIPAGILERSYRRPARVVGLPVRDHWSLLRRAPRRASALLDLSGRGPQWTIDLCLPPVEELRVELGADLTWVATFEPREDGD